MFGLDQISWAEFISLMISILLIWYLCLLFFLLWKSRMKPKQNHFEEEAAPSISTKKLQAIRVAAKDFPSEFISAFSVEQKLGITSVYEETAANDGYSLEELEKGNLPHYQNQTTTELFTK